MTDLSIHIGAVRLNNPLILAPLAGVTNLPFRLLAKEEGASLVFTEMVSAAGLNQQAAKTYKIMASAPEEKPVAVQLFGADPAWLARGAELAEAAGADILDLNMGCPVRKVVRNQAGAALLKDFDLIRKIVSAVRRAVRIPLTVKTRIAWSPEERDVLELAPMLADEGVDALTLHPRYAVQMFGGRADWDWVARLVEVFPGPVVGSGDVTRPEHAVDRLASTGCAGVMIGRGAMGNPWIFSQSLALLEGREPVEIDSARRLGTARKHALMLQDFVGPNRAVFMLRAVMMWYTKGLPNSTAFRQSINQVREFDRLLDRLDEYEAWLAEQVGREEAAA